MAFLFYSKASQLYKHAFPREVDYFRQDLASLTAKLLVVPQMTEAAVQCAAWLGCGKDLVPKLVCEVFFKDNLKQNLPHIAAWIKPDSLVNLWLEALELNSSSSDLIAATLSQSLSFHKGPVAVRTKLVDRVIDCPRYTVLFAKLVKRMAGSSDVADQAFFENTHPFYKLNQAAPRDTQLRRKVPHPIQDLIPPLKEVAHHFRLYRPWHVSLFWYCLVDDPQVNSIVQESKDQHSHKKQFQEAAKFISLSGRSAHIASIEEFWAFSGRRDWDITIQDWVRTLNLENSVVSLLEQMSALGVLMLQHVGDTLYILDILMKLWSKLINDPLIHNFDSLQDQLHMEELMKTITVHTKAACALHLTPRSSPFPVCIYTLPVCLKCGWISQGSHCARCFSPKLRHVFLQCEETQPLIPPESMLTSINVVLKPLDPYSPTQPNLEMTWVLKASINKLCSFSSLACWRCLETPVLQQNLWVYATLCKHFKPLDLCTQMWKFLLDSSWSCGVRSWLICNGFSCFPQEVKDELRRSLSKGSTLLRLNTLLTMSEAKYRAVDTLDSALLVVKLFFSAFEAGWEVDLALRAVKAFCVVHDVKVEDLFEVCSAADLFDWCQKRPSIYLQSLIDLCSSPEKLGTAFTNKVYSYACASAMTAVEVQDMMNDVFRNCNPSNSIPASEVLAYAVAHNSTQCFRVLEDVIVLGNPQSPTTLIEILGEQGFNHAKVAIVLQVLVRTGLSEDVRLKIEAAHLFKTPPPVYSLEIEEEVDSTYNVKLVASIFANPHLRLSELSLSQEQNDAWRTYLVKSFRYFEVFASRPRLSHAAKVSISVALIRACLQSCREESFASYFYHKLVSLMQQLQFIDRHACVVALREVVSRLGWDELRESFGVVLCLAVDLRDVKVDNAYPALDVIDCLFSFSNDPSFKEVFDYFNFFLFAFEDSPPPNIKVILSENPFVQVDFMHQSWENLANGITAASPQIQTTALRLLKQVAGRLDESARDLILIALSTASTQQNARSELKETQFEIGQLIAECYGLVGAAVTSRDVKMQTSSLETGCRSSEEALLQMVLAYKERYTNSEMCFYAINGLRSLLESQSVSDSLWHTSDFVEVQKVGREDEEDKQGLKWLIGHVISLISTDMSGFSLCQPLAVSNLEFSGRVLGLLLVRVLQTDDPFIIASVKDRLEHLLLSNGKSHKLMLLQVLERVRVSQLQSQQYQTIAHLQLVDFDVLFGALLQLDLPKALYIQESLIRGRFVSENKRLNYLELLPEEAERLSRVYIELKAANYLTQVPGVCLKTLSSKDDWTARRQQCLKLFEKLSNSNKFLQIYEAATQQFEVLEQPDDIASRCLDLVIGSVWRLRKWKSLSKVIDKYFVLYARLELIGIESFLGTIFDFIYKLGPSLKTLDGIQANVQTHFRSRAAQLPQAYEYVLVCHIIENFRQLLKGCTLETVLQKDAVVDKRFLWRELLFRAELAFLACVRPGQDTSKVKLGLIKCCITNNKNEYALNFLESLGRLQPIFQYYSCKISALLGEDKRVISSGLSYEINKLNERDYNPALNADVPFVILLFKLKLLYTRLYCEVAWQLSPSDLESLEAELALSPDSEASWLVEKSFVAIAQAFDRNSNDNPEDARQAAMYFVKALKWGHSCHLISMTRSLCLYFKLVKEARSSQTDITELHEVFLELVGGLPLHVIASALDLLLAHCTTPEEPCKHMIKVAMLRLIHQHPSQMAWVVHDLCKRKTAFLQSVLAECGSKALLTCKEIILNLKKNAEAPRLKSLDISHDFELARLALPIRLNFKIVKVDRHLNLWRRHSLAYTDTPVYLTAVDKEVQTMASKAKPKRIKLIGSDNSARHFLLKSEKNCDMRKESRIASLIEIVDSMLETSPEAVALGLHLPSYSIISISPEVCIIEWLPNTVTLRTLITDRWEQTLNPMRYKNIDQVYPIKPKDKRAKHSIPENWQALMKAARPVLSKCLVQSDEDPAEWLQRVITYSRSLAAWSMFVHVIGLGDRHCDNILMHKHTSQLIFIDLECIFEYGKSLAVPENVPFRLTPELLDALGVYGELGEFEQACEVMLDVLKQHKDIILAQVERFVYDPLIVKIMAPGTHIEDAELKSTLKTVSYKLEGMSNRGRKAVSTRVTVKELIEMATDQNKLREMYEGWAPWM
jgi:hypothetical protein